MPVYTDKRSGRLYVQFDYKRQTFKQYLPEESTLTDARKLEIKMRSDVFFQANGMAPRDEVLFEDYVQEYLGTITHNSSKFAKAEYVLIAAKPFLKGKSLRGIKAADIEKFMRFRTAQNSMHGRPRKPATIWREVSVLSALFSHAVKNDRCEVNPVSRVQKPSFDNVQNKVLNKGDEEAFLAAFDPLQGEVARDICILVLNTGLRQNDVLGLTDFHLHGNTVRLTQGKTHRIVEIPLNDTAREIIDRYRGNGLLFPSPKTGRPMHYIRKAISGACKRVNKVRKKLELPPMPAVTIRDLRRTFATRLAEAGVDALTISRLLGHRDLRMVHRYARSSEVMQEAVLKLDKPKPFLALVKK